MKYRPSHLTLAQFLASYSPQVAELLKVRTGGVWRSVFRWSRGGGVEGQGQVASETPQKGL
jgi:uncharacterized protein YndB with AHSA1/START domain